MMNYLKLQGPNRDEDPDQPSPQPPTTPDICDSTLAVDAAATLRGIRFFFKDQLVSDTV